MFTGIVQFTFITILDGSILYLYANQDFLKNISVGDSVAIDGVCLTVVKITENYCTFELSEETLSIVNFKYNKNRVSNIELALKYGDFLGGHIMSGHVHQLGTFISLSPNGNMWIDLGNESNSIKHKGSIAINGVSLTIAEINDTKIRISLIPETIKRTNLGILVSGDKVNLEFDLQESKLQVYDDAYYMRLAIKEGEKGKVTAPPNPWVGCVIVKDKKILSFGYHEKAGNPHAEVNAIKSSYISVKDSTLYVTLEPCCHYGRTPPCTNLLIKEGIKTVVVGVLDPDERVSGNGIQKLKEAGIEVLLIENIDKCVYDEVKYSLRQYLHQRKYKLPYLTAKIALSLDNCYRNGDGSSKWITHEESRKEGHILRSQCQAIIIGGQTVQQDDPSLDVRYGIYVPNNPLRVVIDGKSLVTTDRKVFINQNTTMIMTSDDLIHKWENFKNKIIIPSQDSGLDLKKVVENINALHCLVEGGGKLQHEFFKAGLVNELVIFRSSKIFGENAYFWNLPENVKLNLVESKIIIDEKEGNNIMERYIVEYVNHLSNNDIYAFDDVNYAISEFKRGNFVLVMDDENRENEGDLVIAASKITENQMIEMINHTTGIICVPIEKSRAKKLNLPLMCDNNTDINKTAFTVTVDYLTTGTGVSSKDRLATVRALADESLTANDFRRPGHIFPLVAHPEGFKARKGHTEASIALCKLAKIYPRVAVIGELQGKDGKMKKRQECYKYAQANHIPIITVQQLVTAMENFNEPELLAECDIKSKLGNKSWKLMCFGNQNKPHKVFIYPNTGVSLDKIIPVRIHSECFTGDVFMSEHCDCGEQLKYSMDYIVRHGEGIIIFPSDHEGRGIGIVHKVKAYQLQKEECMSTFEANQALGLDKDARTYEDIGKILDNLQITKIELLTENTDKISSLKHLIVSTKSINSTKNEYNTKYLETKKIYFSSNRKYDEIKLVKDHNPYINLTGMETESLKIALVYSMWHSTYISQIRTQLKEYLHKFGVKNITEFGVPGSNEIPFKSLKVAKDFDGIICIGILIKGDTLHFENVSTAVSNGIMQAQLSTRVPMMNCVMSCLNMEQVVDRITGEKSTLEYIARSLINMIRG
ncbi:deoxycytidylate deaminase [Indivirus ILV1]|uniref:Deoxycytidylate deaminase n=1 Tax=Indivirus ILV1 TaxID=1977633 RepID=A0A1V0SE20_9VIRU|nr:deoxycytidylate deaminase [Indivirus ILV1]